MAMIKFGSVYDATDRAQTLMKLGDYERYKNVFVFRDTFNFWLYRIAEEDGRFVVEMNNVGFYDTLNKYEEEYGSIDFDFSPFDKRMLSSLLDTLDANKVCFSILLQDSSRGFENWDSGDYPSYEAAFEAVSEGRRVAKIGE